MFVLDSRLRNDTLVVGQLPLSSVLLSKDSNYPWCILVPRRNNIREIYQLERADRLQLLEESCILSEVMDGLFKPSKMNVAALGNMVPQLHLHHIARYENDPAWPGPIWGAATANPYTDKQGSKRLDELQRALAGANCSFEANG